MEQLAKDIVAGAQLTIMTGAGVSAESGISTFRGDDDSLWSQYDPMTLASAEGFTRDPQLVWNWYQWRREQIVHAEPNDAHRAIAWLQKEFDATLVTQNVDDLHERGGSQTVCHLHGSIMIDRCQSDSCAFHEPARLDKPLSRCPECHQEYLRPGVVWFGESLNESTIQQATHWSQSCDWFFSVGTSSQVYPAASFAQLAKVNGAKIVEINPEATPLTTSADLVIAEPAGYALKQLRQLISEQQKSF